MSAILKATARVDGTELARVLNNALAFVPARSNYPVIRIGLDAEGVYTMASDTYTIGTDETGVDDYDGPPSGVQATLSRTDAQGLEKVARFDRKGKGVFSIHPGDAVTYTPEMEGEQVAGRDAPEERFTELFTACDELMGRLYRQEGMELPCSIAFQPDLLARFAKIKTTEKDTVADFWIFDDSAPVLVKIGETFRGAIMPITRDKAIEGALW